MVALRSGNFELIADTQKQQTDKIIPAYAYRMADLMYITSKQQIESKKRMQNSTNKILFILTRKISSNQCHRNYNDINSKALNVDGTTAHSIDSIPNTTKTKYDQKKDHIQRDQDITTRVTYFNYNEYIYMYFNTGSSMYTCTSCTQKPMK